MILALDPGLATCGYAIVTPRTARVVTLGVIEILPRSGADEHTDRVQRASLQAKQLADLMESHDVTTVAAEGISLGGPPQARTTMAVCLGLCWGVINGLAEAFGADVLEVRPKQWQHAIMPGLDKINYDHLFKRIEAFAGKQAFVAFNIIRKSLRNHALDAVGVGIYAALSPSAAQRVTGAAA